MITGIKLIFPAILDPKSFQTFTLCAYTTRTISISLILKCQFVPLSPSSLFTFSVLFLNRPLSGVFHVYIIYSHPLTLYINLTIWLTAETIHIIFAWIIIIHLYKGYV